jgi:hypothetical protein
MLYARTHTAPQTIEGQAVAVTAMAAYVKRKYMLLAVG